MFSATINGVDVSANMPHQTKEPHQPSSSSTSHNNARKQKNTMSSRKEKKASGSGSGSGGKKQAEEQREQLLQAVVLADAYEKKFRPLTLETPRCLFPLANTPLIDYTLEFLALAGVEDVFIFVSSHAEKIEAYIRGSKWNLPSSPFKTCQIIMSPSSSSVGDAMREVDQKQIITTDFLLLHGDFIGNLPLENVLEEHNRRRRIDKNAIMTMVLREAGSLHRTKPRGETGVFVIESSSNRCVHYDEIRPGGEGLVMLPSTLTKEHSELTIRADLIDCFVDICSPDVPALFTENFDYRHIRRHFLHGILTDYDLYSKTIHTHIISGNYAARVRNLQTYDAVSRDIMSRWTYPLCPDSNLGTDQTYALKRGNIYTEDDVILARSSIVGSMTVLGTGTSIGEKSIVGQSVVGRECTIGSNTLIERAYIWDSVTIGDGCKINNAIIASGATLGANCIIEPGAVISYGVKLADGTVVKGNSKICYNKKTDDVDDSDDEQQPDEELVGAGGLGYEYEDSESEDEEELQSALYDGLVFELNHANISDSSISTFSVDGDDSEDEATRGKAGRQIRSDSVTTAESDDNDEAESWHKEASQSLFAAVEGDHPVEVASLELNSLRMTNNASWHQVRHAVVTALTNRIEQLVSKAPKTISQAAESVYTRWRPLIKRTIHERKDQLDFLLLLQKECCDRKQGSSILLNVAQKLFELELVEEEAINNWWANEKSSTEVGGMGKVRKSTEAFVKWLAEAEEESEEEEEDSDDDSGDDGSNDDGDD